MYIKALIVIIIFALIGITEIVPLIRDKKDEGIGHLRYVFWSSLRTQHTLQCRCPITTGFKRY